MAKKTSKVVQSTKTCSTSLCRKCCGTGLLFLGILILLNSLFYVVTWDLFIAIILIIYGLLHLVPNNCTDCNS